MPNLTSDTFGRHNLWPKNIAPTQLKYNLALRKGSNSNSYLKIRLFQPQEVFPTKTVFIILGYVYSNLILEIILKTDIFIVNIPSCHLQNEKFDQLYCAEFHYNWFLQIMSIIYTKKKRNDKLTFRWSFWHKSDYKMGLTSVYGKITGSDELSNFDVFKRVIGIS